MNNNRGYGNYDLHPCKKIEGYEGQAFAGAEEIIKELQKVCQKERQVVVCDCYPGVSQTKGY